MRKIVLSLGMCAALIAFNACKSKEKPVASTTPVTTTTPAPSLLSVAEKKFPGITQADLDEGQKIFTGECRKCHGEKKIATRDETKWKEIMDRMAPKAKLDDKQKEKVLRYVLSQRALEVGS
jgi:mono/diheme cytochrome c family protein